jgi:predicted AAA+ superfamily ATPase
MKPLHRNITKQIKAALSRGKSVLLLGARQTGKTTTILELIKPDIVYSFLDPELRLRFEKDPTLLIREIKVQLSNYKTPPVIFLDEVQKIPSIMDSVQLLIDQKKALFILSSSSVRKLRHGKAVNLLPGRVLVLTMDPLHLSEMPDPKPTLEDILTYGTLPHIFTEPNVTYKEEDLHSYVITYLEEEIRAEALTRNIGQFARFLELAASESGCIVNLTKLSQEVGVAVSTISEYYQILEDCMVTFRIDPIIKSTTRRRLIKSPKYLFFDLGIKRVSANEGISLSEKNLALSFEQFIGLELLHQARAFTNIQLHYWRDSNNVEVDFIIRREEQFIPIEVKWSNMPSMKDIRHVEKFLAEYPEAPKGYVICRTPKAFELTENITALPWQEINKVFE